MSELPIFTNLSQQLYMADVSASSPLPKHYIWQSPLLLPEDLSDFNEFHQRVKQAGILWLKNDDLRPFNLLVIVHKTAWMSYIFQRAQIPNQAPIIAGPIPRRLIRKGTNFSPYNLIFQEFKEVMSDTAVSDVITLVSRINYSIDHLAQKGPFSDQM